MAKLTKKEIAERLRLIASREVSLTMFKEQATRATHELAGCFSLTGESKSYVVLNRLIAVQIAAEHVGRLSDEIAALKIGVPFQDLQRARLAFVKEAA